MRNASKDMRQTLHVRVWLAFQSWLAMNFYDYSRCLAQFVHACGDAQTRKMSIVRHCTSHKRSCDPKRAVMYSTHLSWVSSSSTASRTSSLLLHSSDTSSVRNLHRSGGDAQVEHRVDAYTNKACVAWQRPKLPSTGTTHRNHSGRP